MLKKEVGEEMHAQRNKNVYGVHKVPLPDFISDTTTAVKMDSEGSELQMLRKTKAEQGRNIQHLMIEYCSAEESRSMAPKR